jgi:Zn-dependent peptidase ImmA (M78 family)
VTGDELRVKGEQLVTFRINGETYRYEFCVYELETDPDVIIGTNFFEENERKFRFGGGKTSF